MPPTPGHITLCICTFRRASLLEKLLKELQDQVLPLGVGFSVVVVDNDSRGSARTVVDRLKSQVRYDLKYDLEPEQNIALARNRAVSLAEGEFLAFIDDDESPSSEWVKTLLEAIRRWDVDGVMGPVIPRYEKRPPGWVVRGGFFDRPSPPTGTVLEWEMTRTGNVLVRRSVFPSGEEWFRKELGSGGEDRDFFRRAINRGCVFMWCREAPVFEIIPSLRWKRINLLKRALLRGKMANVREGGRPLGVMKSMAALFMYGTLLLPTVFLPHHLFMKTLIRFCDHLGKVMAWLGVDLVKEKYVSLGSSS